MFLFIYLKKKLRIYDVQETSYYRQLNNHRIFCRVKTPFYLIDVFCCFTKPYPFTDAKIITREASIINLMAHC